MVFSVLRFCVFNGIKTATTPCTEFTWGSRTALFLECSLFLTRVLDDYEMLPPNPDERISDARVGAS